MSAATADVLLYQAKGDRSSYPVAAATTIYKGTMVAKSAGYATPLTDGLKFVGHAMEKVINTTAEGFGTAGDLNVQVLSGRYSLEVAIVGVNEYMVGAYVYAADDQTYTLAPMMTPVGRITQYVSSGYAVVEFDTNLCRQTMGGVIGIFEPFFYNVVDGNVETNNSGVASHWTRTSVNGAGIIRVVQSAAGVALASPYCGGLVIVPDTAENDSESIQLSGELFGLSVATKPVFFGTRIMHPAVTAMDTIIGLAITDTTLLAGNTDGITLRVVDASADVNLLVEKNDTETTSASAITTLVNSTYTSLGFVYDGTSVYPYVNGVRGTALVVTNLPNDEGLTVSIEHTAGASTDGGLTISFVDAYQIL